MSKWRERYRVHPAADVFPMMSDEELAVLGGDIKKNGLRNPICLWTDPEDCEDWLIDGRNRLEAMERAGIRHKRHSCHIDDSKSAEAAVIGLNILRRHLTQEERADLIWAAAKAADKPRQAGGVSDDDVLPVTPKKGGRGRKSPTKQKALEINAFLPKEQQVGERTLERAGAKAEGRPPAPAKPRKRRGSPMAAREVDHEVDHAELRWPANVPPALEAARQQYLKICADPAIDLDSEQAIINEGLREIAGKRLEVRAARQAEIAAAMASDPPEPNYYDEAREQAREEREQLKARNPDSGDDLDIPDCLKRASTLPQGGRSEDLTPGDEAV